MNPQTDRPRFPVGVPLLSAHSQLGTAHGPPRGHITPPPYHFRYPELMRYYDRVIEDHIDEIRTFMGTLKKFI